MARIVFTQDGTYDVSVDPTHSDTSTYYVGPLNGATVELGYRTQESIILYEHGPLQENSNLTISHGYLHQVVAVVTGLTQPIELTFNKGGVPSYHGVLGAILEQVEAPIKEDAPPNDLGHWRLTDSGTGISSWVPDPIQEDAPAGRHARDGDTGWVSIEPELQEITNKMEWKNVWAEGTYDKNDVVTDEGWLMIANKQTGDRPAPQTLGGPSTALPDVPGFVTQQNGSVVYSGHLYTFTQGGWIQGLRVWVPTLNETTNYQIVITKDPYGAPQTSVITSPVLNQNSWSIISLGNTIALAGDQYLVFVDALDSGTSTTWQYPWTYSGTSGTQPPGTGNWNRNNSESTLRIDKLDGDGVDHTLELQVIPNTTFTITQLNDPNRFVVYTVTGSYNDVGAYYTYPIDEIDEGPNGKPLAGQGTQIRAEQPVASLTDYSEAPGYWAGAPAVPFADIQGYLAYDGISQPGVEDNAYGVDISFQRASVSDDWDFMSFSGSTTGGGGGSDPSGRPIEEVILGSFPGYTTQTPTGIGAANSIIITFGPGGDTSGGEFTVGADGVLTCNMNSIQYEFDLTIRVQRTGGGGTANAVARMMYADDGVNFIQLGDTFGIKIDDGNSVWRENFNLRFSPTVGSKIYFEFARDAGGVNAGEIGTFQPGGDLSGAWNQIPSSLIEIYKIQVQ